MPAAAYGQIVKAVSHKAVLRNECFLAIVVIRLELVVSNATEAGVSRVQTAGPLVQIGVRQAQHQAVRVAVLQLGLKCVGTAMAEVPIGEQEIAQVRER